MAIVTGQLLWGCNQRDGVWWWWGGHTAYRPYNGGFFRNRSIMCLTVQTRALCENEWMLFSLLYIDIPVIPYLEEVQEEDLMMQVAAPPRYHLSDDLVLRMLYTFLFTVRNGSITLFLLSSRSSAQLAFPKLDFLKRSVLFVDLLSGTDAEFTLCLRERSADQSPAPVTLIVTSLPIIAECLTL